ncbi:MAG: hypothetical protein JWO41_226 [Candidatus Saccharibacteria bacterium]|nr:hypothetical protein [Candidatus Saccharibacteria bacterium]
MEDHIPKAIPSSLQEMLRNAFATGAVSEIHNNFYQAVNDDTEPFDQGNGVGGLPFVNFPDKKISSKSALVISNSCDTSDANEQDISARCTYCAVRTLASLRTMLLEKAKISEKKVNKLIDDIKSQRVSDMMYIPRGSGMTEESVAMLSFVMSADAEAVEATHKPTIVFTLSQNALYLLLTKLSIHFLRFGEIKYS